MLGIRTGWGAAQAGGIGDLQLAVPSLKLRVTVTTGSGRSGLEGLGADTNGSLWQR